MRPIKSADFRDLDADDVAHAVDVTFVDGSVKTYTEEDDIERVANKLQEQLKQ